MRDTLPICTPNLTRALYKYGRKFCLTYDAEAISDDGRVVLRENFRKLFEKYPELITFGEDTGKIGGVNQSMEGMQEQFGDP